MTKEKSSQFYTQRQFPSSSKQFQEKVNHRGTGILRNGKYLPILFLLLFFVLFAAPVAAATDNSTEKVSVTEVTIDPEILVSGDTALITATVMNSGTDNIEISDAHLITKDFDVINYDTYSSLRTIAAGTSMDFTFTIRADNPDGVYYPSVYFNFRGSGSLKYTIPVRVEEAALSLSAINIPDPFVKERTDQVTILIGNPKNVLISGIEIVPSGKGMVFNQSSYFVGELNPHNTTKIAFDVTPSEASDIIFNVTYWSGINQHATAISLPVAFGIDKMAAQPIISNVEISQIGGTSGTISGDVSNIGMNDAYAVIVSLDTNTSSNPNSRYVVGTLETDDFSSFELSLPSGTGRQIPLVIEYKDEDGNLYKESLTIDQGVITSGSVSANGNGNSAGPSGSSNPRGIMGNFGSGMSRIPVTEIIAGIIILIVGILGYRYYKSRKKDGPKNKGRFKIKLTRN